MSREGDKHRPEGKTGRKRNQSISQCQNLLYTQCFIFTHERQAARAAQSTVHHHDDEGEAQRNKPAPEPQHGPEKEGFHGSIVNFSSKEKEHKRKRNLEYLKEYLE